MESFPGTFSDGVNAERRPARAVVGATGLAIMAIVVPVLCLVAVVAALYWVARKAGRLLFGRRNPPPPAMS